MKGIEMHLLPSPIVFKKLPDQQDQLEATVTALSRFPTFRELFEAFAPKQFGFENAGMEEMLRQIHEIYSCEQERYWGVL